MKFLNHVGWVLTPEILQLASLLYDAFVTLQPRPSKVEKPPTLDEVKAVFRAAEKVSPLASAMWSLLAETGFASATSSAPPRRAFS